MAYALVPSKTTVFRRKTDGLALPEPEKQRVKAGAFFAPPALARVALRLGAVLAALALAQVSGGGNVGARRSYRRASKQSAISTATPSPWSEAALRGKRDSGRVPLLLFTGGLGAQRPTCGVGSVPERSIWKGNYLPREQGKKGLRKEGSKEARRHKGKKQGNMPPKDLLAVQQLGMIVPDVAYVARDGPGLHVVSREGLQQVGWGRCIVAEKPLVIVALVEDDGHPGMDGRGQLVGRRGDDGEALQPLLGLFVVPCVPEAGEGKGAALVHGEGVGLFLPRA